MFDVINLNLLELRLCHRCSSRIVFMSRKLWVIKLNFRRRFLLGLQKYGKGDWRNISRNFVISKTPTQVASHAQKYFLRQNSEGKDKRRPSIHDITTANLSDNTIPPITESDDQKPKSLLEHSAASFPLLQKSINIVPNLLFDWSNSGGDAFMVFDSTHGLQNLYSTAHQGASAYVGSH